MCSAHCYKLTYSTTCYFFKYLCCRKTALFTLEDLKTPRYRPLFYYQDVFRNYSLVFDKLILQVVTYKLKFNIRRVSFLYGHLKFKSYSVILSR